MGDKSPNCQLLVTSGARMLRSVIKIHPFAAGPYVTIRDILIASDGTRVSQSVTPSGTALQKELSHLPTISTRRKRASLALGTALALIAASLTIGISPAAADRRGPAGGSGNDDVCARCTRPRAAVVDREQAQATGARTVWKIEGGGDTYRLRRVPKTDVLPGDRQGRVRSTTANTIFAAPPEARGDCMGRLRCEQRGRARGADYPGDKEISHIIVCPKPSPGGRGGQGVDRHRVTQQDS